MCARIDKDRSAIDYGVAIIANYRAEDHLETAGRLHLRYAPDEDPPC
jgi:hypothetical protein